jgi:hypothetical protein
MLSILCQIPLPESFDQLTGLGAAGMMGVMWLWERRNSRQREQQLDEAHSRILADQVQLDELIAVVRANTEALARVATLQEQLAAQFASDAR